jgi:outer membrane protein OmpA-like peptidoglycan-associated protein
VVKNIFCASLAICIGVGLIGVFSLSRAAGKVDCDVVMQQIKLQRNILKQHVLLQEALANCPDNFQVNYQYAYNSERLRKYDEALKYYIRASEIDNASYPKVFFGIGDIYMVLGNSREAIKAYEKGLALEPNDQRRQKSLELARIKYKSESGADISSDEFVQVMKEDKSTYSEASSIEGPILRVQIQFQTNSADLTAKAYKQLAVVAEALRHESLNTARFEISGHTDNLGAPERNMSLSKTRAEMVRTYLIHKFKIAPERLTISYYGPSRPAQPNTTNQNRAINRRVEFKRLD